MLSVQKKEISVKMPTTKKNKKDTATNTTKNTKSGNTNANDTNNNNKPTTKKPVTKKADTKTPLKKRTVKRTSSGSSLVSVKSINNENNNKKPPKKTKTGKPTPSPPKTSATKKNKTAEATQQPKPEKIATNDDTAKITTPSEKTNLVLEPAPMEIDNEQEKPAVQTAVSATKHQNLASKPPRPSDSNTNKKQTLPDASSKKEFSGVRHQDSINLYKNGWGPPGQALVVTKSSAEQVPEINKAGRPIFHLPLNLNDSTASFQGNSPSYLEMSSGLVPYHPQNKYNFRISLDETHDMSQTASMLKNFIFDENDQWDTNRTESSHMQKHETAVNDLKLPEGYDDHDDTNIIIPSTETTSRSFVGNQSRTSTRLSFLFNKNTGLLCKNCFSTNCTHIEKFDTLATPKLKKVFKGSSSISEDRLEENSSDISQQLYSLEELLDENTTDNLDTTESLRLIDVNDVNHKDLTSGECTNYREINMEYETQLQFETSTPNEMDSNQNKTVIQPPQEGNGMNMSGSMLRYTPAIMNHNGSSSCLQQPRPNTSESLKYDSDYDDDSYLKACVTTSANSTFETLDINSGVLFYNIEQGDQETPPLNSSSPSASSTSVDRNNNNNNHPPSENKRTKTRRISLGVIPELPTVFEEKSAPNSAMNHSDTEIDFLRKSSVTDQTEDPPNTAGLDEILNTVTGNLASMFRGEADSDSKEGDKKTNSKENELDNETKELKTEQEYKDASQIPKVHDQSVDLPLSKTEKDKNADHENELRDSLEMVDDLDDKDGEDCDDVSVVKQKEETACQTPLEAQGIFRRIKTDEEEARVLDDDELQAVLRENRRHTFERHYFFDKLPSSQNDDNLDPNDKEVLEINTPEWVEQTSPKNSEDRKPVVQSPIIEANVDSQSQKQSAQFTVDASTQSDLPISPLPMEREGNDNQTPQTSNSSEPPKTQGSYHQIDLLVLDRGRDRRLEQENQIFQLADAHLLDMRDVDSGVHSDNTARTEATQSHRRDTEEEAVEEEYEIRHEEMNELSEDASSDNSSSPRKLEMGHFWRQQQQQQMNRDNYRQSPLLRHHHNRMMVDNERVYLPAIGNPYYSPFPSSDQELYYSDSANSILVDQQRYSPRYVSSEFGGRDIMTPPHRDLVSPILEHHIKMAHYHRERVALLTPLYSSPSGNNFLLNRHTPKPRPPESKVHMMNRNFKRKYLASRNAYYGNLARQPDYLDSLSDISPRTKPFVPHPPSYDRGRPTKERRINHNTDEHKMAGANSLRWRRKINNSGLSRTRTVSDSNHDTTLYLTTPYRSMYR